MPSQCIVRELVPNWPTAQISLAATAAIPLRVPTSGPGTMLHWAPSQCKICEPPTTQTSFAETAATPERLPMSGLGTTRHAWPQSGVGVRVGVLVTVSVLVRVGVRVGPPGVIVGVLLGVP